MSVGAFERNAEILLLNEGESEGCSNERHSCEIMKDTVVK